MEHALVASLNTTASQWQVGTHLGLSHAAQASGLPFCASASIICAGGSPLFLGWQAGLRMPGPFARRRVPLGSPGPDLNKKLTCGQRDAAMPNIQYLARQTLPPLVVLVPYWWLCIAAAGDTVMSVRRVEGVGRMARALVGGVI